MEISRLTPGRLNPSRETKFSGTHGDRGILIIPVQLTTSRIGNHIRLIKDTLAIYDDHTFTYQVHTILEKSVQTERLEWLHRVLERTLDIGLMGLMGLMGLSEVPPIIQ